MSIVFDFADIKRRMDRKPQPVAAVVETARAPATSLRETATPLQVWSDYEKRMVPVDRAADDLADAYRYMKLLMRENRAARALMVAPEATESDLLSLRLQADKRLIESDGWETLWAY